VRESDRERERCRRERQTDGEQRETGEREFLFDLATSYPPHAGALHSERERERERERESERERERERGFFDFLEVGCPYLPRVKDHMQGCCRGTVLGVFFATLPVWIWHGNASANA
jgi:hypothetical protein